MNRRPVRRVGPSGAEAASTSTISTAPAGPFSNGRARRSRREPARRASAERRGGSPVRDRGHRARRRRPVLHHGDARAARAGRDRADFRRRGRLSRRARAPRRCGLCHRRHTVWCEGAAEVARRFRPKLVIAFAGSAEPRGPFHVTMDSNDVIETAHAFPEAAIVAVHNHGWAHFKESPADLQRAFAALGVADRLTSLEPGRPTRFPL